MLGGDNKLIDGVDNLSLEGKNVEEPPVTVGNCLLSLNFWQFLSF